MSNSREAEIVQYFYPESSFASFSRGSQRFVFFSILADIITPDSVVLDFGAGRGVHTNETGHMARISNLRGRVRKVIGVDPDPGVFENPWLDDAVTIEPGKPVPLPDGSVDVVISLSVLEHVRNPAFAAAEISRVLKPGGWFCAYTPNKYGYPALCARLIPNSLHGRLVQMAIPSTGRTLEDAFPTVYRMNTVAAIRRYFPAPGFSDYSFIFNGYPGYNFGHLPIALVWWLLMWLLPTRFGQVLFVFVKKN